MDCDLWAKKMIIELLKEQNKVLLETIGEDFGIDPNHLLNAYWRKEYYLPIFATPKYCD
jgi:hypothetical protein